MKVTDASQIRGLDAKTPAGSKTTRDADRAPSTSDKVSTDSKATLEAATAAAQIAAGSDRTVRLEAIEAAVRNGAFKPDPQRIAARILDDAELSAKLQAMLNR